MEVKEDEVKDDAVKDDADLGDKKRKLGDNAEVTTEVTTVTSSSEVKGENVGEKKVRRKRWGECVDDHVNGSILPGQNLSQEVIQQTLELKNQLQQITEKLGRVAQDAAIIEQDPRRSPSPPPKYDAQGKRTNTREVRMRESLTDQRGKLIEELIKVNPNFQPPADYMRAKPFRRIYMPVKEFPNYNFVGLVIGPRGATQKQLEQETGCKISIRGKGSVKDGGRITNPDADDELHVYISGDNQLKLDAAAKMIEDLIKPIDDTMNEHKQKQLRELALINGTLRENEYCPICGEKGHKQFECPFRQKSSYKAVGVKCSICGDYSHPTRDCPMKQDAPNNTVVIDNDYNNFMAELTGNPSTTKVDGDVDDATIIKSNENNVSHIEVKQNGQTIIHATLPINIPNAPNSAMPRPIHITGMPMMPPHTMPPHAMYPHMMPPQHMMPPHMMPPQHMMPPPHMMQYQHMPPPAQAFPNFFDYNQQMFGGAPPPPPPPPPPPM